jgi:thiamine-phosphate pyrophosphorylase
LLDETREIARYCRAANCIFLINDDAELAFASGADGVHLGKNDAGIEQARALLGKDAIIGISCYNRLDLAHRAEQAGADYVAFGRFFPSLTKPDAIQAQPALLQQAKRELELPLVAIGGITPENGRLLLAAGADMLAVIHALFGQPDIGTACRHFQSLFQSEVLPQ